MGYDSYDAIHATMNLWWSYTTINKKVHENAEDNNHNNNNRHNNDNGNSNDNSDNKQAEENSLKSHIILNLGRLVKEAPRHTL